MWAIPSHFVSVASVSGYILESQKNHPVFAVSSDLKVFWVASGAGTGGWRVTALPPPVDSTFSLVQTQRGSSGSWGGLCRAGCVWRAGVAGHSCGNSGFSVESALISTDALPLASE